VSSAIRGAGIDVETVSHEDTFVAGLAADPDFVVVDASDEADRRAMLDNFLSLSGGPFAHRSVLFGDVRNREEFLELLRADLLHQLIATSAPGAHGRLTVTAAKLTGGELFGLEKYLPWGTVIESHTVRSSEQKARLLEALGDYAEATGMPSRLTTLAHTVADEFLMNAIFDAPVDTEGKPLFADRPRSLPTELPEPHTVRFSYCCTGGALALAVYDSFGSLSPETVRKNLLRTLTGGKDQIRRGTEGAGVGLYMAFGALSDWIINIVPGQGTEMIGIIRTHGTYRDHIAIPKSFHLFCGG
jgi:hypothetical protein